MKKVSQTVHSKNDFVFIACYQGLYAATQKLASLASASARTLTMEWLSGGSGVFTRCQGHWYENDKERIKTVAKELVKQWETDAIHPTRLNALRAAATSHNGGKSRDDLFKIMIDKLNDSEFAKIFDLFSGRIANESGYMALIKKMGQYKSGREIVG